MYKKNLVIIISAIGIVIAMLLVTNFFGLTVINANTSNSNVIITEVLYDTPDTDSEEEWIELYNPTDSTISISGWTLEDNAGSYTLSGNIPSKDYMIVACDSEGFSSLYGFTPDISDMTLALSNSGDEITLYNSSGSEIDFVAWENYVTGWSISARYTTIRRITSADTDTNTDWEDSGSIGNPGEGDYEENNDDEDDEDDGSSESTDDIKIMAYNIKESGESSTHPDWDEVVKEENADVVMFVETGTWDDNNDENLNSYIDSFNSYFSSIGEEGYTGYTTQDISYSTSGEAIMSRYPIVSVNQIETVILDDSTSYDVTHDFYDCTVNINNEKIHIIGAHLKAMTGSTNEQRREYEQEGIINYMDNLGDVPIIYLGDLNSFSPEDYNINSEQSGLGYGPISMLIEDYVNPETNEDNSQYASNIHSFTDVYRELNNNSLGITNPDYDSRIDFIFVNQNLDSRVTSSTVGDTDSADTGSDHFSVDFTLSN
jgi:endonuclease/exonuclease/phosphatase family metal-dependent hydrolase